MPAGEVLRYFREKDPRFKDVPDADLTAYIKDRYPDFAKDLTRPLFSGSTGEQAKKSRVRLANLQHEGAESTYKQDVANAKGQFAGTVAAGIPAAAAAPFTGGASVPVAMGLMGAAGLAGGVARETTKAAFGSTEMPASKVDLAMSLGLDTAMGAAGEGFGRGIGYAGKTLIPKLIQRSAAKSEAGKELLEQAFTDTRQRLYSEIEARGNPRVNVERLLQQTYDRLVKLPGGAGKVGERFSAPTAPASEVIHAIEKDLAVYGGQVSSHQPLAALVRMKGSLQKMAFENQALNTEERRILKDLAAGLDTTIKRELGSISPEAQVLYKKANDLMITQKERSAAIAITQKVVGPMVTRMAAGATIGGAAGYYYGQGNRGGTAAAAGAAAGAATAALAPHISTLILEQAMSHPQASVFMRKAISFMAEGNEAGATAAATRAFAMVRAKDTVKDAIASLTAPIEVVQPASSDTLGTEGKYYEE